VTIPPANFVSLCLLGENSDSDSDFDFYLHEIAMPSADSAARIDKWLWAVRLFKTRSLAADACRAGSVRIGEHALKPARDVRVGETIVVKQGVVLRTLVVRAVPLSRVGAPLVSTYCEDLTPPSEWEKAKEQRVQHLLAREEGSGRPTKRDRRMMDRFLG